VIGVTYPNPFTPTGVAGFLMNVTDNGATADVVDYVTLSPSPGQPAGAPGPTTCPAAGATPPVGETYTGPFVVDPGGDITITDALSVPTSKEQCQNGGYTSFGFKNQGQCVAFVQRGPKP
jgi:hypothetical protein